MKPSDTCYLKKGVFPHIFLIPSIIILSFLAFLNKRRSFKKDVWGGRPGLVIPLDFLGIDNNRLSVSAIFGVATGLILQIVLRQHNESRWIQALMTIISALEVAMFFYPLFACLATEHKLIGSIIGLFYSCIWCIIDILGRFDKCVDHSLFVQEIFISIPMMLCYLFILGRFFAVIFSEARESASWTGKHEHELQKMDVTKPWSFKHVRNLLKPTPRVPENRCIRFLRLLYSPKANFHFTTQTMSIVVVCCNFLYAITVELLFVSHELMERQSSSASSGNINAIRLANMFEKRCNSNIYNTFGSCIAVSALLVAVVCVFSIVRFMECHKNNMLRMFKGDTSFIPKGLKRSQFMVGKCLKYTGYQIGYFVWGYIVLLILFLILTIFLAVIFDCDIAWNISKLTILTFLPYFCITLPLWLILIVASVTIFRERSFKKDVIAVNNRNVYLVVSYFYFFLGLPMGFFSAMYRLLKAIPVGFFMLPRVDQCVMLDGFQRFDNGFEAYICYLYVQAAHRSPVLRVFCQVVHDAIRMSRDPAYGTLSTTTKRYRNKWFLLVTLIRNPQLQRYRKHMINTPALGFVGNATHMSVEMPSVI